MKAPEKLVLPIVHGAQERWEFVVQETSHAVRGILTGSRDFNVEEIVRRAYEAGYEQGYIVGAASVDGDAEVYVLVNDVTA